MKKLLTFLLTAALALSLAACGKDYSADFTDKLNISSFDITETEVIALEDGVEYETNELDDRKVLTFDNGHIYGFSTKDGSFEFVKWRLPDRLKDVGLESWETVIDAGIDNWTEDYGEPEVNEKIHMYVWYGNVDGENASLAVTKGLENLTPSMIELDKVK